MVHYICRHTMIYNASGSMYPHSVGGSNSARPLIMSALYSADKSKIDALILSRCAEHSTSVSAVVGSALLDYTMSNHTLEGFLSQLRQYDHIYHLSEGMVRSPEHGNVIFAITY